MDKNVKKTIITVCIALIMIITVMNVIVIVPTGFVGIVTRFGAVKEKTMVAGINVKFPFIENVQTMNCKTQKLDLDSSSASKDLQDVKANISINYSIDTITASELFKTVGVDYVETVLRPSALDTIKSITAQYTAEELITKRPEVASEMLKAFNMKLNSKGITISNSNIIDLNFSEAFNKAIEEKQVAEQNVKTEQQKLEKIKVQAEQKVVEATSTAESNRILNQSLSVENLEKTRLENQKQFIEKWNGTLPTTMLNDGITSIFNVK